MSHTHKHQKAYEERREGDHKINGKPDFDGKRYGNNRKWVAKIKIKDRRRTRKNENNFDDEGDPKGNDPKNRNSSFTSYYK